MTPEAKAWAEDRFDLYHRVANNPRENGTQFQRCCKLDAEIYGLALASADLTSALRTAESFMAGFEGDELQDGIDEKLTEVRAAIAKAEGNVDD